MRIILLKDKNIKDTDVSEVMRQVQGIFQKNAQLTITYDIEERDFSKQVGQEKYNFDSLPYGVTKLEVDLVFKRHKYDYDHVIFLVHKDHCNEWAKIKSSTGKEVRIWGENFSNIFYKYDVEICRFDPDKLINTVGTLYHELHHSLDVVVKTWLGIQVEKVAPLNVTQWDQITHGTAGGWKYIRTTENQESLVAIAPLLQRAYKERLLFSLKDKLTFLQTIQRLTKELTVLQRQLLNKKITKCLQLS